MMDGYYDGSPGWGGWVLMIVMMVGLWALVAAAVVAVVRRSGGSTRKDPGGSAGAPGRILDERFARGEIDADEYQARKAVLAAERRR